MTRKLTLVAALALAIGGVTAVIAIAAGGDPAARSKSTSPTAAAEVKDLPLAPESDRVDLARPSFPNPTKVTNPLFPISEQARVVLLGNVDRNPLRVEVTLLPETKTIDWNGRRVETLVSQYVAFLDGRIHEVALDWYAQAADGSVWYFGEDVFNYDDGVVADTEGTWLAGKDGPAAMIMPRDPRVGAVYRPENIPGVVLEEVTVKSIGKTVSGPHGPIGGAIVVEELHMDGKREGKVFAPGYGEFSTGAGGDREAVAIAVPADALSGPLPAQLATLSTGAATIFDAAESGSWKAASATLRTMVNAWAAHRRVGDVPELLAAQMNRALTALAGDALAPAVNARNPAGARKAAIDVARAGLDLQLPYRRLPEIDLAHVDVWTRQLLVDAFGDEPGRVAGDVATLERIWDRVRHSVRTSDAKRVDARLDELRAAADDEDVAAATQAARGLRGILVGLETR